MPEYQVLSLSPELFFAVEGDRIRVRPMKGTSSRCVEHEVDQAQAQALKASEKNRAENLMIVDLLRNDLGRVAKPGSVVVESLFDIEAYATVHQMTSTISATLETTRFTDLITALFPCGSITGAPKVAAMQKIDAWETAPRGLYTGTIGWAISEKIQANVAIRTLVLDPPTGDSLAARTGVLGVGSGIVWDSNAEAEYAECLLKSDFLVKPDPGFTLFETLRLELPAAELEATLPLVEIYPRYRGHRARLSAAAFSLGFAFNEAAFESMLWQVKAEIREKANGNAGVTSYRVRIDLEHDGALHSSWAALPPVADRVALIWATERLDGSNPLLRYKTSARSVYDAAIETAVSQQAFDALFCNQAGLVCEGGRSNVFVKEGNRLLTPPVRCGLLPGVLRAELLSRGEASESLLTIADIKAASREGRLRVGNALRGLMPAYLK
jgi:para-aminobenzoate synthetase/4-amino-4-deoxychorismate lyase